MFNRKLYVFPVYERNGTAQKLCRVLWTLRKIIAAVRTARQTKNSAENQLKKKKKPRQRAKRDRELTISIKHAVRPRNNSIRRGRTIVAWTVVANSEISE